ncbi:hypothetical protein D3C79_734860 [compost metagenome]
MRFETLSSNANPGLASRSARSIGGSTSTPSSWLAVTRTVPPASLAWAEAARAKASAASAMDSAWATRSLAVSVGINPAGERTNRLVPTLCSNASIRRRAVAWAIPSARAAAERLPVRRTARKTRWVSHCSCGAFIHFL